MAGSISGTTAAILAAGVGLAGAGLSAYVGSKQNSTQQAALKNQTQATQQAESNALSTERKNSTAQNMANQQTPDVSSIMARAALAAKGGIGSTMLTGSGGVAPGSLNLGKSTLLGS